MAAGDSWIPMQALKGHRKKIIGLTLDISGVLVGILQESGTNRMSMFQRGDDIRLACTVWAGSSSSSCLCTEEAENPVAVQSTRLTVSAVLAGC